MTKKILLINGPNLNKLGVRDNSTYGTTTLAEIENNCKEEAHKHHLQLDAVQHNCEGKIIDAIHDAMGKYDGIIINAGAYSHYSIAIYDALLMIEVPIIEVHLSNIYKRDEFRHFSYIAKVAKAGIFGMGAYGYILAVQSISQLMNK